MRSQHANYTLRQHYSGKLRLTGNPMKSHAVKITSAVSMIGLSLSFVLSFVTFVAPTRPSRVIPHLHKHLLRVALAHAWRPWGLKLEVGMEDGVTRPMPIVIATNGFGLRISDGTYSGAAAGTRIFSAVRPAENVRPPLRVGFELSASGRITARPAMGFRCPTLQTGGFRWPRSALFAAA